MPPIRWRQWSGGWWPQGSIEAMPAKTLRRATGVHSVKSHVLRSRWGSTLLFNLAAVSLRRYAGARFAAAGTDFYRNGVSIKSGLSGNRLAFVRMPPGAGVADYLFVAGGGSLFKVDPTGVVTNWGIAAPTTNFNVAAGAAGARIGTYKYAITFFNSVTGSRSLQNPATQTVVLAAQRAELTSIPVSTDPQVDSREIWRTNVGGTILFRLAVINDNVTTAYSDDAVDAALSAIQLPTDNAVPNGNYQDACGPFYGRIFWARVDIVGRRGQVPYSAAGRPESDVGFVLVASDDEPVQKVVIWAGSVWAFTNRTIYQIIGQTEPFSYNEIYGAPGTTNPFTVVACPYGIIYQSGDAVYLFNGYIARRIGFDALGLLFQGETLEGVTFGAGITATYGRNEYVLSDGLVTLALNPEDASWRNVGTGLPAISYEEDTLKFMATVNGKVVLFEEEGVVTDANAAITFEVETAGQMTDEAQKGLVQRVYFELNTNGQFLQPSIRLDGNVIDGVVTPPIATPSRQTVEIPVNQTGRVLSIRLTGSLTQQVEIFGVKADVWVGSEAIVPTPVSGQKSGVIPLSTSVPST